MSALEDRPTAPHSQLAGAAALAEAVAESVPGDASESDAGRLLAAAVRIYAATAAGRPDVGPFPADHRVTATDVAVTTTAMLGAVQLEVFELGMWQVWGRA